MQRSTAVLGHAQGIEVLHGKGGAQLILEGLADLRLRPLLYITKRGSYSPAAVEVETLRLRAAQAPATSSAAPAVLERLERVAREARAPLRRWAAGACDDEGQCRTVKEGARV